MFKAATPSGSAPDQNREFVGHVNVFRERRKAPFWEEIMMWLMFFVTYAPWPSVSPILYLLVAGYMAILVFDYRTIVPVMLKSWPVFLLPLYGLWSFTWSPFPPEAFRTGVLYLLTPIIIVIAASRLSMRQVIRALMFAGICTAVLSVPHIADFAEGGLYPQKNYFAIQMLFLMLTALATCLNPHESIWVRMIAFAFVPVAFVFQFLAESATSLVFGVLGIAGMLVLRFFWVGLGEIRHLRTMIFLSAVTFGLFISLTVLNLPQNEFVNDFLELVGKDSSLSGRTAIWEAGRLTSAEHPIFGVGLEGFWYYENGMAQTLNENDHKEFGSKLSFHSAYWETRVHLGWIGWSLFVWIVVWGLYRTVKAWLVTPSMDTSAVLVTAVIIVTSTFTESYLWGTFNTSIYLYYFGAISAFGAESRALVGKAALYRNVEPDEGKVAQ